MELFWYVVLMCILAIYVVLDGYDFGAGIVHLFFATKEKDKKAITNAIGPFWDANEVWLIASGGVLFFAFPTLYASSFSGFYLPLIMILWLLIFRAIGLELRGQIHNKLWEAVWDKAFDDHHIHIPGNLLVFTHDCFEEVVGFASVEQLLRFLEGNRVWRVQVAAGPHKRHRRVLASVVHGFCAVNRLAEGFVEANADSDSLKSPEQAQAHRREAGIHGGRCNEETFCHNEFPVAKR